MRVDVSKLREKLEELDKRRDETRTIGTELTYSCFLKLGRRTTAVCERCRHYETRCRIYLREYEIVRVMFKR